MSTPVKNADLSAAFNALRRRVDRLYEPDVSFADFCQSTLGFPLHDWQKNYLCPILERCKTERGLRIAIHGPPQYGKSIIVSQRLPAYLLMDDPTHRVGLACYNETRASEFGKVIKDLITDPYFTERFGDLGVGARDSSSLFSTTERKLTRDGQPSFVALGLNTGFTGRGVDTLIVDDPYKDHKEAESEVVNQSVKDWWNKTARVRIKEHTNVIVMFHRYHDQDFAAEVLSQGFEYVRFPAEADSNEDGSDPTQREIGELLSPMQPRELLEELKEANPYVYFGMFQGKPIPDGGGLFKAEYFEIVDEVPDLVQFVWGWDLAVSVKEKADYTVGVLLGIDDGGTIYIVDVNRFKKEWPEAHEEIQSTVFNKPHPIGGDATMTQMGFWQQMTSDKRFAYYEDVDEWLAHARDKMERRIPFYAARLKGKKKERASAWAHRAKRSGVKLLRGAWNDDFLHEVQFFTGIDSGIDDQVDAVSIAYDLASKLPYGRKNTITTEEPFSIAWIEKQQKTTSSRGGNAFR